MLGVANVYFNLLWLKSIALLLLRKVTLISPLQFLQRHSFFFLSLIYVPLISVSRMSSVALITRYSLPTLCMWKRMRVI